MALTSLKHPAIVQVPTPQRAGALALICCRLSADDRADQVKAFSSAIGSDEGRLGGLLGAYRNGRLVGAVFSQVQPGKTAAVWPPRVVPGEPRITSEKLLEAACDFLENQDVCTAQALIATDSASDKVLLCSGGFEPLADLLYLASLREDFPDAPPPGPLRFEPYTADDHDRLARIIEATYEQTLDCPRLGGVRRTEDVLAGYHCVGLFDPGHWLIVRHRGDDVGCLLLADHPEHGNIELLYMGVVASARRNGWGMDITRHAQWLAAKAACQRLVLAVDAANTPAIKMYTAAGFQVWDRRSVYMKVFARPTVAAL